MNDHLLYVIALTKLKGVGPVLAKQLLDEFGCAQTIFEFEHNDPLVENQTTFHPVVLGSLLKDKKAALKAAEKELELIDKENINVISYNEEAYPVRLRHCPDPPTVIYARGDFDLDNPKVISIVGTRKATSYGVNICERLVADLSPHNPLIVSGLAYGIDVVAHKSAMVNGLQTIGVLGHGLSTISPTKHFNIAQEMCENGGLLTEFPFYTRGAAENFPKRNRLVAGLADLTLVVESSKQGGSLITARLAQEYNREVAAIPGALGQPQSVGCNDLIKHNRATLIDSATDIEQLLDWNPKPRQLKLDLALDEQEKPIVQYLIEHTEASVDELANQLNISMNELSTRLLELEFKGVVQSMPGKRFTRA